MAHVLIVGSIFKGPEAKTSANGHKFTTATLKVRETDNSSTFWNIRAFAPEAQTELLRLHNGEGVSCQGVLQAQIYTPEGGEPRISYSMMADNVLALKQPKKESAKPNSFRKPAAPTSKVVPIRKPDRPVIDSDLDDECPF